MVENLIVVAIVIASGAFVWKSIVGKGSCGCGKEKACGTKKSEPNVVQIEMPSSRK